MMTRRFSSLFATLNEALKTNRQTVELVSNDLCCKVLRLLRDRGLIYGFSFISPKSKTSFPYIRIYLKNQCIKQIVTFKNTKSNFYQQIKKTNHLFLISNSQGLLLTQRPYSLNKPLGKLLACFSI